MEFKISSGVSGMEWSINFNPESDKHVTHTKDEATKIKISAPNGIVFDDVAHNNLNFAILGAFEKEEIISNLIALGKFLEHWDLNSEERDVEITVKS